MKKAFTLNNTERLKSRKSIDALFTKGNRFSISPFKVFYQHTASGLRFGTGVGKRNFKKATDRNRIKRLIREAYRLRKNDLKILLEMKKAGLDIFFIYTEKEMPVYEQLSVKVGVVLEKIKRIADENNTPAA